MIASYSEYLKAKALYDSGDLSASVRSKLEAALGDYKTKYMNGSDGADLPLPPEQGASAISEAQGLPSQDDLSHATAAREPEDLTSKLDSGFALLPQALATQPATTHPEGDATAKDEWIRGDLNNPNGIVVVYDAPMTQVRKDLAEHPDLLDAVGQSISPGSVVQKGDAAEQAYQQMKWREVADAAAKAGKTAYRYSQAPWLGEGKGASVLDSLSTKLGNSFGVQDTARAFILGADNLGSFGMLNAAGKAGLDQRGSTTLAGTPAQPSKWDYSGSVPPTSRNEAVNSPEDMTAAERNASVKEEHPGAYAAGQVVAAAPAVVEAGVGALGKGVGALSEAAGKGISAAGEGIAALGEWAPSNQLWNFILGKPAETVAGKVVGGAVKNAIAGGVSEGLSTAAEAGANYAKTGSPGMTAGEAGQRVLHASEASGALGGAAGVLHSLSSGFGNWVREGDHYRQLPGKVKALGSEPRFGRNFSTPPAVEAARAEARARPGRPEPIDTIAEKTDKPLAQAVKGEEATKRAIVHQENEEVFASPEGRAPLPTTELVKEAAQDLRKSTSPRKGSKTPSAVGLPGADRPARAVLNMNVDVVSVTPVAGAIPMSPEEAQSFLHPVLQEKAMQAARTRKAASVTDTELATVAQDYEHDLPGTTEALAKRPAESPRAPRAPTPELSGTETRFSPEGPDHRPGRRETQREAPSVESTGGGPMVRGARPQGAGEAAARETGPRGEGPPQETRYSTQPPEGGGSRWKRPGAGEGTGTTARELRKAGVDTVYVLPRKYDARRHETVIHLLRTGGGDSEKARRLTKFYHAALRDRDARPWQGEAGGWSKLQQKHEEMLATAKDLRKRVAPKGSAYAATIAHGQHTPGRSRDIDAMQRAAEIAGGNQPELVRAARIMQPLDELQGIAGFGRSRSNGKARMPFGLSALSDAAILRGMYPVTRAIERTPHGGAQTLSRLSLTGMHDLRENAQSEASAPKAAPAPSKPKRKRYSRHNPEREKP